MQRRIPRVSQVVPITLGVIVLAFLAALVAGGRASASPARVPAHRGLFVPLTSTLVINEVYDSSNPANEYFEIYNGSISATVDLTSYVIYNHDGSTPLSNLPSSVRLVGPQQYRVIGPAQLGTPTIAGSGLDSTDFLGLVNNASDAVVDVVNWGNAPNPNWPNFPLFQDYFFYDNIPTMPAAGGPRSLSRYPNGYDTDTGLDWYSLPQSPGRANPAPVPAGGTATPTGTVVGCEDRFEPDNSLGTAKTLEQNTEQVHTLCIANGATKDRDWVVFPAVAGKLYTILTKDLTGPVDTIITLYDAAGNALAENDDATPGQGLNSRIDYTFGASGVYYVQTRDARSNGGLGYQYTIALISTGTLPPTVTPSATATLNPNATPTPGVCYDTYEPDGVPSTAHELLNGTVQQHSFCPAGDADWTKFFARAGKVYTIRTATLGVGVDTFMYIFDSTGTNILAQNDDGGDGLASRIDFYAQYDSWYYVQVKNAGDIGGSTQTYELNLTIVPGVAQPPPASSPVIAPVVSSTPQPAATQIVAATKPPLPTPTQGQVQPTPTTGPAEQAASPTIASSTSTSTSTPASGVQGSTGEGTPPVVEPTESVVLPGVPATGHPIVGSTRSGQGSTPGSQSVVKPQQPAAGFQYAPMLFRIFYDATGAHSYQAGQGIRGIQVLFPSDLAGATSPEQIVTAGEGVGSLKLSVQNHRIVIPYFGVNMPLTAFPSRELHSLWLPPVKLPDRVP